LSVNAELTIVLREKEGKWHNSYQVVLDDIWAWRADHGSRVGWTGNVGDTGVVVNGDHVTAYGLFVEHYEKYEVIWIQAPRLAQRRCLRVLAGFSPGRGAHRQCNSRSTRWYATATARLSVVAEAGEGLVTLTLDREARGLPGTRTRACIREALVRTGRPD
jgi:hypothetical protein